MRRQAQTITKLRCVQCGHVWIPRTDDVRRCPNPKCGSVRWDKPQN